MGPPPIRRQLQSGAWATLATTVVHGRSEDPILDWVKSCLGRDHRVRPGVIGVPAINAGCKGAITVSLVALPVTNRLPYTLAPDSARRFQEPC